MRGLVAICLSIIWLVMPSISALEFGRCRAEQREAVADERVAPGAEHQQHALVAIDELAVAREHQADRRQVEHNAVVEHRQPRCGPGDQL